MTEDFQEEFTATRDLIREARQTIFILILSCTIAIMTILFMKYRLSAQIDRDVIRGQKLNAVLLQQNEKAITEFMERTVKRWEDLRVKNPSLDVPVVAEPIPSPKPTATP